MSHAGRAAFLTAFLLPIMASGQTPSGSLDRGHQPMRLDQVHVSGTRLPIESIIRVSGLKPGQMIDDDVLKQASEKITSTGLMKGIDYEFNTAPGGQGVDLAMKVFDEQPLLPAHILPAEEAEPIWSCLQSADPIFTREMPNTEKAIHFYSINIARCMKNEGVARERVSATVACDGSGKSIAIDFHVRPVQPATTSH